jgi:hypothetical protein
MSVSPELLAPMRRHREADGRMSLGVLLHALLHPERRVARPHGVIFVRQQRAEQGHMSAW